MKYRKQILVHKCTKKLEVDCVVHWVHHNAARESQSCVRVCCLTFFIESRALILVPLIDHCYLNNDVFIFEIFLLAPTLQITNVINPDCLLTLWERHLSIRLNIRDRWLQCTMLRIIILINLVVINSHDVIGSVILRLESRHNQRKLSYARPFQFS